MHPAGDVRPKRGLLACAAPAPGRPVGDVVPAVPVDHGHRVAVPPAGSARASALAVGLRVGGGPAVGVPGAAVPRAAPVRDAGTAVGPPAGGVLPGAAALLAVPARALRPAVAVRPARAGACCAAGFRLGGAGFRAPGLKGPG